MKKELKILLPKFISPHEEIQHSSAIPMRESPLSRRPFFEELEVECGTDIRTSVIGGEDLKITIRTPNTSITHSRLIELADKHQIKAEAVIPHREGL